MPGIDVTISSPDGEFSAYLARPESGGGPGVIAIQEIFGVNEVMRGICDDLAAQGFVALCPDLFWRLEPGVQLTDKTEEDWKRAFDFFNRFDIDSGVRDIQAATSWLREQDGVTQKVGAVGYCLGGLLSYLTAARTDCDAAVGFYGVNIPAYLGEADRISKPLMLHVAEEDEFVSKEAQAEMKSGLDERPTVTLYSYPGRDHAFARTGGAHFHEADAGAANARTWSFLKEHLS